MNLESIRKILKDYLEENRLVLYDTEMVKEDDRLILRVSLEALDHSITVDELAKANEYLSVQLDSYDADMPPYFLEVCSSGAEKPLRNMEEVKQSIGKYVHIEILNRIYEGILEAVMDNNLTVRINVKGQFKKVVLQYEDIKLIRLAVKI